MARRSSGKRASRETSSCRPAPPLLAVSARNAAGLVTRRKPRRRRRYKLFHQIVDHLHELLPARFPVHVRLGWPGERRHGVCGLGHRRFDICVSSRLPQGFAIDVLIHEWAHTLSWPRDERRFTYRWQPYSIRGPIDHDAAWGRAYAKVYSTVLFAILPRIRKAERAALLLKQKRRRK